MPKLRFAAHTGAALALLALAAPAARAEPDPRSDPDLKKLELYVERDKSSGKVVHISVTSEKATDDDLKLLAQFPDLTSLVLARKITGTGLKHLAGLKKLDRVDLGFGGVNSDGVKELAKLTQLRHVNLINTAITDDDLAALVALADLETLWIGQNFKCTDAGFKKLAALKKLRRVSAGNSNFGDGAAEAFAALPELRAIALHGTKVTDAGVAHLAKAPKLEYFMTTYNLTDKGLKALGGSDTLRSLVLFNADVTPEGIIGMANAAKLTQIDLDFKGDGAKAAEKKVKDALPKVKFGRPSFNFIPD